MPWELNIRGILNKADSIITVSEEWASIFRSISSTKVDIIHNFVDVPDKNLYNEIANYITTSGQIGHRKGYYDLVKVIPGIIRKNKNLKFNPFKFMSDHRNKNYLSKH